VFGEEESFSQKALKEINQCGHTSVHGKITFRGILKRHRLM
jgi:hypothetical protein